MGPSAILDKYGLHRVNGLSTSAGVGANMENQDNHMADGGQPEYHKTSTWDLLKQGWKDLTTPSDPQPAPANTSGTVASGSKGADFDNWVSRNVDAQSQ
jgi:hypothetical protein